MARNTETIVNDIDISAIYVKNLDDTKYTDKKALEEERLRYLFKKHQGGINYGQEDTDMTQVEVHAHDLLAANL